MIERKEIANELLLRETVRMAIKNVQKSREASKLEEQKNEEELRGIIRGLLGEGQAAVASVAKHDNTGINSLEDMLRNTNLLSVLETGYKALTTTNQQRKSFMNHILNAVKNSLAPEEARKEADDAVEITEDIDLTVGDGPEADPDFIDVSDEKPEEVEVDEKDEWGIEGEDKTGRNRAFTDFQNVEKVVLNAFDDLDNPTDLSMFEDYLLKNLSLYFEKWEGELSTDVEPPPEATSAVADPGVDLVPPETSAPKFELQEVLELLDVDDIIENLL